MTVQLLGMAAYEPPKRKRQKRLWETEDGDGADLGYTALDHPNVVRVNALEHYRMRVVGDGRGRCKRFGLQDMAIAYLRDDLNWYGVVLTSDKHRGSPSKQYFVMSLATYFLRLRKMPAHQRCFYELNPSDFTANLEPGSNDPPPERGLAAVHMHLDVEIYCETNPQFATVAEYDAVEHVYLGELLTFMREFLGLARDPERVQLMPIVDSSVQGRKISRHYVIRVGGAMFYNNYHCGALLRHFENHVIAKFGHPTSEDNGWYFWREKEKIRHDPPDPWLDKLFWLDWIYGLHRQLRTYKSSKLGQDRPLELMGQDRKVEVLEKDVRRTSILWPEEPTSPDQQLILIKVTEPDGTEPRSQVHRFKHRNARNPNSISVTANGKMMDLTRLENMNITSAAVEPVMTTNSCSGPLVWTGGEWNGRSGRSKKPQFCADLGRDLLTILDQELRKWYNMSKAIKVRFKSACPEIEPCYYDFAFSHCLVFVFQTKGRYCPFLREECIAKSKPIQLTHSSNNTIVEVDLEDLTYTWTCFSHSGKRLQPEPLPQTILDAYGDTIATFVKTFREDNALDVGSILASLLDLCANE